jgi:hypothetical protein
MLQSFLVLVALLSSPASGPVLLAVSIGALALAMTALAIATMVLTAAVVLLAGRRFGLEAPRVA